MKIDKIILIVTVIIANLVTTKAMCQAMDSSFNYQGELLDNGAPANGQYDINVDLIDGDMSPWGDTSEHTAVQVLNGLFNINVDFNIDSFDGYKDSTITVSIRRTSEGPGGAFTVLGSQTLQAVPLATNLTNGNATTGQVLTFNGFQWAPATPANGGGSNPWTINGDVISYLNSVGVGESNPAYQFEVKSSQSNVAGFNGPTQMYVTFEENGVGRGYIGSYQSVGTPGINDEDFEIGTFNNSIGNLHLVTGPNQPRLTVTSSGDVGINTITPIADLNIEATADNDVVRVRVEGTTKFYLDANGGVGVGSWDTPPIDGLQVRGDMKQTINSNGMMKYMVFANCTTSGATISRSYNGVSDATISISNGVSGDVQCTLSFPTDINNRFWQVSPVINSRDRGAHCSLGSSNSELNCYRYTTSTGANNAGQIMVLVY